MSSVASTYRVNPWPPVPICGKLMRTMRPNAVRASVPLAVVMSAVLSAQAPVARVEQETAKVTPAVTEIRHRIHQNPELSNREEKTGRSSPTT